VCVKNSSIVWILKSRREKKEKAKVYDIKTAILGVAAHVTAKQWHDARRCSRAKTVFPSTNLIEMGNKTFTFFSRFSFVDTVSEHRLGYAVGFNIELLGLQKIVYNIFSHILLSVGLACLLLHVSMMICIDKTLTIASSTSSIEYDWDLWVASNQCRLVIYVPTDGRICQFANFGGQFAR